MNVRQRRYPKEEFARRGKELYEEQVRAQVEEGNKGKIVAIDVDSRSFQLGRTVLEACHRLLDRYPDAQIWCVRIGYGAVRHFGPRRRAKVT